MSEIKFAVGFQLCEAGAEPFSELVRIYRTHISELFFAWQDIATGRSAVATRHGYTDWTAQKRTEDELRRIKEMGIKLDLLFNGNCYGAYALSQGGCGKTRQERYGRASRPRIPAGRI